MRRRRAGWSSIASALILRYCTFQSWTSLSAANFSPDAGLKRVELPGSRASAESPNYSLPRLQSDPVGPRIQSHLLVQHPSHPHVSRPSKPPDPTVPCPSGLPSAAAAALEAVAETQAAAEEEAVAMRADRKTPTQRSPRKKTFST